MSKQPTQARWTNELKEAAMNIKHIRAYLAVCSLVVVLQPLQGFAQQNSDGTKTGSQPVAAERDGQHDFDFELGSWKIHLKRLLHPLTGSTTWVEFDGTSVTRRVWDGHAQLEEFETDNAAAGHIEGLTLRLHNPQSNQWSLYWANSKGGPIFPPQIGEFRNRRGEFYAQDMLNGKSIFVRFVWTMVWPIIQGDAWFSGRLILETRRPAVNEWQLWPEQGRAKTGW